MGHGISTKRDFVWGLIGTEAQKDWHGLTVEKTADEMRWPEFQEMQLSGPIVLPDGTEKFVHSGFRQLVTMDDLQPVGKPFNPDTFGYILPDKAEKLIREALSGTQYTIERMGMLWDRAFWFASVHLNEFSAVSRAGHRTMLNFSGALDGSGSPEGELSDIRAVCWNTISLSRATGQKLFRVKQSKNSADRLNAIKNDVETACGMIQIFNDTMKNLEETPATENEARCVYAGELARAGARFERTKNLKSEGYRESRAVNVVNDLTALFASGDGNSGKTRADVLNGFTQYFTRGGAEDSKKDVLTAFESSEFQGNATRKAEFFATITRGPVMTGKRVDKPAGWNELLKAGKTALETAGAI